MPDTTTTPCPECGEHGRNGGAVGKRIGGFRFQCGACGALVKNAEVGLPDEPAMTGNQAACPGCGAPSGYPPAGPCENHGTASAVAKNEEQH